MNLLHHAPLACTLNQRMKHCGKRAFRIGSGRLQNINPVEVVFIFVVALHHDAILGWVVRFRGSVSFYRIRRCKCKGYAVRHECWFRPLSKFTPRTILNFTNDGKIVLTHPKSRGSNLILVFPLSPSLSCQALPSSSFSIDTQTSSTCGMMYPLRPENFLRLLHIVPVLNKEDTSFSRGTPYLSFVNLLTSDVL